jgi:CheY-like chemotaxis protein
MPMKHVLDVGNCAPDHRSIRSFIEAHFDAQVLRAHGWEDTRRELTARNIHLVLVNRKLDRDYSDGVEIIREIKADPQLSATPCMLITNYQEHQRLAEQAGAVLGFGKLELHQAETLEKLRPFLD